MTYPPSAGWPWPAGAAPQGYDALTEHRMEIVALKEAPQGYDALTEHRMEIVALKEAHHKRGEEVDDLKERVAALEKLKEAARRWALSLSLSGVSLLGHWQQEPIAKKASAVLSGLAAALK